MYIPLTKSFAAITNIRRGLSFTIFNPFKVFYATPGTVYPGLRQLANMTGYSEDYIKERLSKELDPLHLEVVDYSDGCGAKFNVVVVSPKFEGKSLLERHRMVNSILAEEMKTIHAFTQKTLTPEQWKKLQEP